MKRFILISALALSSLTGCAIERSAEVNSDPNLRKLPTQFAADAASRHPYKADAAPAVENQAKGDVDYMFRCIQLANLSDSDWSNCEVWINRQFVVYLPAIERATNGGKVKTLEFSMFFDSEGNQYRSKDLAERITRLEVYREGKMYNVPLALAD